MKKLFYNLLLCCVLLFVFALRADAQTYLLNAASNNTTVSTCGGTFYDSGGSGGNYANNENYTISFCSNASTCIVATFTAFRTQGGNDILTVYDGPNNTYPVLGTFSGSTLPPALTSSSGCLTFKFVSNGSNTRSGWAVTLSCVSCSGNYNMTNGLTVNTCSGLFFDSGGSGGTYSNNQTLVETFCSNSGNCLMFVFTSFNTQSGRDTLTIFDGASTAATRIGVYSGTTLPPTIISTTGCLTFRFKSDGSTTRAGWSAIISCVPCPTAPAGVATYTAPTTGMLGTYVGSNMVNTCSGTFTDDGGTGGNYSNNVNGIYRTFCPDQPGTALRMQFWSFYTDNTTSFGIPNDYLEILNGATQNSPQFNGGSAWFGGPVNTYQACMSVGLGPYISTDQSGCITVRFNSNSSTNRAGWVATFDCVPYAAGPNGTDNSDCVNSTGVCSNQAITDASTGPGLSSDLSGACVPTENYTNWYTIKIQSGGKLGFTIAPNTTADDYDFALFGPNPSCGSLGSPIRCSYASNWSTFPNTGMNSASNLSTNTNACGVNNSGSDNTEDACGNGWTNELAVTTGETYQLVVSKWTPGGSGFSLNWLLTSGASLDCSVTPLPIELLSFSAKPDNSMVKLSWTTATETNNDYFTIERSKNGIDFQAIGMVDGAGNSTQTKVYSTIDGEPSKGLSYYRLKQTDYDGKFSYSEIVPVRFESKSSIFIVQPNPAKDNMDVVFSTETEGTAVVQIFNSQGQVVLSKKVDLHEGVNRLPISLDSFIKGVYFVTLENGLEVQKTRLVKE